MTGDGVNDALPLKALTLGLLWELMGQPFPKAADMVLLDDNFLPF
jgi:magnesium-transporting ATPase (P-type)